MLINKIDELAAIIPTVTGDDFQIYAQAIKESERWLNTSLLGKLFDSIDTDELLREKCKEVVAYRAYRGAIAKLDLINTGNGFAVVNDSKLAPASRDRVKALIESITLSLSNAEGDLCEYLEDQYADQWASAPGSTIIPDSLIQTLREFSQYARFTGSYEAWRISKPLHQYVMRRFIRPVISGELTDKLINLTSSDPEHYRVLREDVRYSFAAYICDSQDAGKQFIDSVRAYLNKHPNDFPEFKNSNQYHPPVSVESIPGLGIFI